MASNGQAKALETTLANLKKRFGDGAIMKLGEAQHLQVESIPTGSLALDIALGKIFSTEQCLCFFGDYDT